MVLNNDLHSDLRTEKQYRGESLHQSTIQIEAKDFQEKMEEFKQRQQLRDIFKQAYFWSRTKNKSMSTSILHEQEMDKRQMVHLKKIQKNLTFMHYIKSNTHKS